MTWTELHVYLHDVRQTDAFVSHDVPAIAAEFGCADAWFFIRYWLGGPHVRLRLRTAASKARVEARVADFADRRRTRRKLTRERFYEGQRFDGVAIDAARLPWFEDGAVVQSEYVPETHYYGVGEQMMRSETLFCRSSQLAAALVSRTSAAQRPLVAAELLLGSLHAARGRGGDKFLARYCRFLQPFDDEGSLRSRTDWSELAAQANGLAAASADAPIRPAAVWAKALADWDVPAEARTFRLVLMHHLLLNRIGVVPSVEAKVLAAVTRSPSHADR